MINVQAIKEKILKKMDREGPSLPVPIARAVELSPMFSSAILSELVNEGKLKLSKLKVGSSPLYLKPGQEQQLEKFTDNLKGAENLAFQKLKLKKIIEDEKEEPAMRVALRSIKDFAVPLRYKERIIWKYAFISNQEAQNMLSKEKPLSSPIRRESKSEKPLIKLSPKKERTKKTHRNEEFISQIKENLLSKDIEFLEELSADKKELIAKVRINSDLGKISFLLIARDKKRISEADLTVALQKALNEKMPCLFLSYGEPSRKTLDFVEANKNILKIGKLS